MAIIKTLGDFRRLTKDLDDNFAIEFRVRTMVPEDLKQWTEEEYDKLIIDGKIN